MDLGVVLELAKGGDLMSYVLKHEVLRERYPLPSMCRALTKMAVEPEGQYFTYQICDALDVGIWAILYCDTNSCEFLVYS